jgi:hypothetical protein
MKFIYIFCILLITTFNANAQNKALSNRLLISSVTAPYNADIPKGYTQPEFAIRRELSNHFASNGYLHSAGNAPIKVDVVATNFNWDNTFGTFTVNVNVKYTLTGHLISKSVSFASSATASLSDRLGGFERNQLIMSLIAADNVRQFNEFLSQIKVDIAEQPTPQNGNIAPQEDNKSSSFTIEKAKNKCTDLGFIVATEAFGKCVLQLSRE